MQLFLESYFAFSGWSELERWAVIREVGSHQTHPDPFGPTDEKFVVWLPGLIAMLSCMIWPKSVCVVSL